MSKFTIHLPMTREAVIYALAQTDYSRKEAHIRVAFLNERIEIETRGILLPGMTIEDVRQGVS